MKKLLLCLPVLFSALAFGQGSVYSTTIYNRIGQAVANASFAVCTAEPTGTGLCQGTSLATTYEDITIGTPCTNVSTATGPTSGTGCTNPGLSDSLGNVIVFSTASVRWGQISGYLITSQSIPFAFPATSTSSIAFNSITGGTNTQALRIGTGGTLLPTGTGIIVDNGSYIKSAGITAPSPLATTACPTGQNPFSYILKADATYQDVASLDVTTVSNPAPPAGTINHCWRTWWNDSGIAMPGVTNSLISSEHVLGHGGQKNANVAGIHERAFSAQITNADASFQGISQIITNYNEVVLSNSPHFYGHAGGETDVSGVRASIGDGRTGNDGTFPGSIVGISSQVDRQNTNALVSTSNGAWIGVRSYVDSTAGGALAGTQNFIAFLADTLGNAGGLTGASVTYSGFWARKPTNLFPINQLLLVDNVGTGANDYDFIAGGVNSAGTAAGFNALVGPTALGQQIHAAANYQFDVLGATKLKAGAGVRQLDLFGSTSSFCGISTDATSTTETHTCPLSSTQHVSTVATGTPPLVVASTTPVANLTTVPLTYNISGTQQTATHIVRGRCTLGTDCAVTLTGSAVFTSSSTYDCGVADRTAAAAVKFDPTSGSAFTLTGTGTDSLSFVCVGN